MEYHVKQFDLVGLSGIETIKAHLRNPNEHNENFTAAISDQIDKSGLWKYCEGNWSDKKTAMVLFSETNSKGIPIDGTVVEVQEP